MNKQPRQSRSKEEWDLYARQRILDLLDTEYALVRPEIEARVSEGHFAESGDNADPHHITNALNLLRRSGSVTETPLPTRGGSTVSVITPTDRRRRATKIDRAAGRKRLLHARFLGWTQGNRANRVGLAGPAGERAVRQAAQLSAVLQPATPGFGEIRRIHALPVPGPIDTGGFHAAYNDTGGLLGVVTVLIEVKNIRAWIYPSAAELYQLLSKAARIQRAAPNGTLVFPILVCRKAHHTTRTMGKQLGFWTIDMEGQFMGSAPEPQLSELRTELAYRDLLGGDGPSTHVAERLKKSLPAFAMQYSERWRTAVASDRIAAKIKQIHAFGSQNHQQYARIRASQELRAVATAELGLPGW